MINHQQLELIPLILKQNDLLLLANKAYKILNYLSYKGKIKINLRLTKNNGELILKILNKIFIINKEVFPKIKVQQLRHKVINNTNKLLFNKIN